MMVLTRAAAGPLKLACPLSEQAWDSRPGRRPTSAKPILRYPSVQLAGSFACPPIKVGAAVP